MAVAAPQEYPALPTTSKRQLDVHTPDPNAYHPLEGKQAAGMRSGIRGVMIPRATAEGGSRGFNAQRPGVINVIEIDDNGCQHRGTVDMELVSPDAMRAATEAAGGDPQAALQYLARQQGGLPEIRIVQPVSAPAPRTNPLAPGSYVVPRSVTGGAQILEEDMTLGAVPQIPLTPSVKPHGQPARPQPAVEAPRLVPESQLPESVPLEQLTALLSMFGRAAPVAPAPVAAVPLPPTPVVQIPDDLRLDFLDVEPAKPARRVAFDLGDAGSMSSRFHAVVVHDQLLALIYDTRWEGDHFLPPYRSAPQTLGVQLDTGEVYQVFSQDLMFPLGCLDIVLLLIKKPELEDPALTAVKDMLGGSGPQE